MFVKDYKSKQYGKRVDEIKLHLSSHIIINEFSLIIIIIKIAALKKDQMK